MLLLAAGAAAAADAPGEDLSFCKEVLILHHSHVDVGFTHPQSMYWELQKDYLSAALDMLDRTEDWPDDLSRPRWTAEATAPVTRWLETASPKDVTRFKKHLASGRLGISAFEYNTTPLCSAESLASQLAAVDMLRRQYGADIRTANQHDVTGLPWSAVDLMLDSGVELFTMAINLHLSGTPMPRPAFYRWQGPSGRELLVANGEHYSMFDQWCDTASRDLNVMQAGLNRYLRHVKSLKYPYDFVYLTATHAPLMYDNSPPNQDLPGLVRKWNEEGRRPRLRMVTPVELLARIKQIPRDQIPVVSGDWTDYWAFGVGSSAVETCMARRMAANAAAIDLLRSNHGPDRRIDAAAARLTSDIDLYNEHTWGAYNTLDADNRFVVTQWHLKALPAYDGGPLSDFLLRKELHLLAGNPWQSWDTAGVLVVNPTGMRLSYRVPDTWQSAKSSASDFMGGGTGKRLEPHFMGEVREPTARTPVGGLGPIELEPFSWQVIPWSALPKAPSRGCKSSGHAIHTDYYDLTFDPDTGKVTRLFDRKIQRELLAADSPWGFFQLVHERPANNQRSAFHVRSVEGERFGRTGWKPDWQARRTSYTGKVACRIEDHGSSASLVIRGQAEGITDLEQRITLYCDSPTIDLSARFLKQDVRSPEAVYFVFPLNMPADWRAHFDTSGIPTELDAEQIPGSCRDWVSVDTFASVHRPECGVTLYCPDAPLVQIGDFNFGRKQSAIPRKANPLLVAWPLNNYWETNFRANQPGQIELRYSFVSHGPFDPAHAMLEGQLTRNPPVTHLVLDRAVPRRGKFLDALGDRVVVLHVKPAGDGRGTIVRLVNVGDKPSETTLALPASTLAKAWMCGTLEDDRTALELAGDVARCTLAPRQITTVRLVPATAKSPLSRLSRATGWERAGVRGTGEDNELRSPLLSHFPSP